MPPSLHDTMEIKPRGKINAVVECPKSKGFTNRALVVAALAKGTSRLSNVLASEDTLQMINGLRSFGTSISLDESSSVAVVTGVGGRPKTPSKAIFAGNSGTTARFLTAVAALNGKAVIDGNARMRERPIRDLADALNQLGASAATSNGFPPVKVRGSTLKGGIVRVSGKTSSQFLSALLMVAPYAEKDTTIVITDDLTSKPFADMTIAVMNEFGAEASHKGYRTFSVAAGRTYSGRDYFIEGDAANASYFFAAAAVSGGKVKVTGINPKSVQGEIGFVVLLAKMGCAVRKGKDWIEVMGGRLEGIDVDMNSMPDAVQTLAVVAAFARGPTTIRNVANLRIKETDRIAALASELRKMGADVKEFSDGLRISPPKQLKQLKGAVISTYNDHRMAMSFAIAGLAVRGVRIENPSCVGKTFPGFFAELGRMADVR